MNNHHCHCHCEEPEEPKKRKKPKKQEESDDEEENQLVPLRNNQQVDAALVVFQARTIQIGNIAIEHTQVAFLQI